MSTAPARHGLRQLHWCFFSPGSRAFSVLSGDTQETGGAEAQIAYLAASFAERGHNVSLIYGDGRMRRPPVTVRGVTCFDAAAAWRRPASIAALWRTLQRISPHVIYARLPDDFLWMLGAFARRSGGRFVYALANDMHCQPGEVYDYKNWFHGPLYALGLGSADQIIIQHGGQLELASPRLRSRMFHVPNLLLRISPAIRPFARTSFDAIWVAKIRPVKRLERFLDLAESLPDLRFAVVGGFDGTMPAGWRMILERRARGLHNLAYLGARNAPDVLSLIAESSVLVNTSDSEGFPNTMLEAWGVGVPVVSLSVDPGGLIERERLGRVSRSFQQLRADVAELAGSESLNRCYGERGLTYVRSRHGVETVHAAFMANLRFDEARLQLSS